MEFPSSCNLYYGKHRGCQPHIPFFVIFPFNMSVHMSVHYIDVSWELSVYTAFKQIILLHLFFSITMLICSLHKFLDIYLHVIPYQWLFPLYYEMQNSLPLLGEHNSLSLLISNICFLQKHKPLEIIPCIHSSVFSHYLSIFHPFIGSSFYKQ